MVMLRKFSEFVPGTVTAVVGLTAGANTIGPASGGGGSSGVTHTFPQASPAVAKGDWLRVAPTSGLYTLAQADSAEDGEVIGVVIAADAVNFTLQQSGYITSAQAVFTGLVAGDVQFLDTATPGIMVPVDATVNGQVSRPVFVPDSPTSGWVVPYRPLLVGGAAPPVPPGPGNDTSLVVVNQTAHGFVPGDVLRVSTAGGGGAISYALAVANTLGNSQVAGIVVANPAPTVNQFTLQFAGYNTGSVTVDYLGNPILGGNIYYLSATTPGKLTNVNPVGPGVFSKPVYLAERGIANTGGTDAGYILPQRPLDVETNPTEDSNIVFVSQAGHGLVNGNWVYVSGSSGAAPQQYTRGLAAALNTSQIAGVVIDRVDANNFYLQTEGYNVGAVTTDYVGAPLVPSDTYYLSDTVPGTIQNFPPATPGSYTKPLFNCEQTAAVSGVNAGYIWGQRPLVVPLPPGTDTSVLEVTQAAHGFTPGAFVYIQADDTYALANPNALPSSQAIGVVTDVIDGNHFVVQQSGHATGVVTHDDVGAPIVSGVTYYLSPTVPGGITSTVPSGAGQYIVPVYVQQDVATHLGWVLPAAIDSVQIPPEPPGNGAIIQVRYTTYRDTVVIPVFPSAATPVPQLNTNITLANAANAVKVTVSICNTSNFGGCNTFKITRNGVIIPNAINSAGNYNSGTFFTSINTPSTALSFFATTSDFTFIDAPGGVGPFTYGIICDGFATGNLVINQAPFGLGTNFGISTMILEEIG